MSEHQMDTDDGADVSNVSQVLTFCLGAEEYGIEILEVQEIKGDTVVTRMPNTPPHVPGVTNLRGAVIPIIDLRLKFGLPAPVADRLAVVIIGLVANKTIGFAVDSVIDVLDIPRADIQEPPELVASGERPVVRGIAHVDGRLVALLDLLAVVGGDLAVPA